MDRRSLAGILTCAAQENTNQMLVEECSTFPGVSAGFSARTHQTLRAEP